MATPSLPYVVPFPHSAPVRKQTIPHTFRDALKQGWCVVRDESKQSRDEKRREGKVFLQKPGSDGLLEVEYIGSVKGFRFSVPKLVSTN